MEGRSGMSLIEVVVAMALTVLLCGGLFGIGLKARRFAEHGRVAIEARTLAKQKLEEIVGDGRINIAQPTYMLVAADTNVSSRGYPIVRRPYVIWHAADGATVGVSSGVYAEVHVDVSFWTPLYDHSVTNSFSMIVE